MKFKDEKFSIAKLSGSKALRKQHDKGSIFIGLQTGEKKFSEAAA